MTPESNGSFRRQVTVLTAIVVTVSFVGFFMGTRPVEVPAAQTAVRTTESADTPAARTWAELQAAPAWQKKSTPQSLAALRPPTPAPDSKIALHPEKLAKSLTARAHLRAFDGAPPQVPHPVPQRGGLPCLVCHAKGAIVGDLRAPAISHETYASCTQCHVPLSGVMTPETELAWTADENTFVGLRTPGRGTRAWEGAPPTIPHPTQMRTRCASCHGPAGREGLQTSHPWRQSCTQCHGLSATLDQRPVGRGEAPPPWATAADDDGASGASRGAAGGGGTDSATGGESPGAAGAEGETP